METASGSLSSRASKQAGRRTWHGRRWHLSMVRRRKKEKIKGFSENPLDFSINTKTFKAATSCILLGVLDKSRNYVKFMVAPNIMEMPHIFLF